jgi:hypothetical protein
MRQHPDPDPDEDQDDLEELGTPFYQGTGLSVRALSAEELQQFLDAHADQPAELLGSGWAALDPPDSSSGCPGPPGPLREPSLHYPNPRRRSRPSPPPAAWATPAAPPSPSIGATAPASWPPGPAA